MRAALTLAAAVLLGGQPLPAQELPAARPVWIPLETGSHASLRGLSALDAERAWASGAGGTVLRTADGGATWERLVIPGGEELDLRDVELFPDGSAVLMTAGQPARLYRVEAAGGAVVLAHESPHATAFFDGVAFWDSERGLAFSDPVEGRFLVLSTEDGGRSWWELSAGAFPPPLEGEAGFAASGSNLAVGAGGLAWIGTGGGAARVLRSADFGVSWSVAEAPMGLEAPTAGIFSIAFRDAERGVAAGGDYESPESAAGTLSWSADGGATWAPASVPPPSGHRAAVRFVPGRPVPLWISVGRAGSDLSTDDGRTWRRFSEAGFYTLSVGGDGSVWAAGSDGRVARLEWVADPEREDRALGGRPLQPARVLLGDLGPVSTAGSWATTPGARPTAARPGRSSTTTARSTASSSSIPCAAGPAATARSPTGPPTAEPPGTRSGRSSRGSWSTSSSSTRTRAGRSTSTAGSSTPWTGG